MKDAVETALAAVIAHYGDDRVRVVPDDQGGAWIEIASVELDDPYEQASSFVICLLPFNLPIADIYPLFFRADLARLDGQPLGDGFSVTELAWPGDETVRPVVQVSRKTRGSAFAFQTPLQKIRKVIEWVRSR